MPDFGRRGCALSLGVGVALALGGCCGLPNKANIELRKQNQTLQEQIDTLKAVNQAQLREIDALYQRIPTIPTLPPQRLEKLFVTHGLEFLRLTGGIRLDPSHAYDDGLNIYIVPTDGSGQPIKAAGSFTVDAFDLADRDHPLLGHWQFSREQAAADWNGHFLDYNYVLGCPWQAMHPKHGQLTLKVTFLDELTQLTFNAQKIVTVSLPTSTRPATRP